MLGTPGVKPESRVCCRALRDHGRHSRSSPGEAGALVQAPGQRCARSPEAGAAGERRERVLLLRGKQIQRPTKCHPPGAQDREPAKGRRTVQSPAATRGPGSLPSRLLQILGG